MGLNANLILPSKAIISISADKLRECLIGKNAFLGINVTSFDKRVEKCIEMTIKMIHDEIDKM